MRSSGAGGKKNFQKIARMIQQNLATANQSGSGVALTSSVTMDRGEFAYVGNKMETAGGGA
jgi:hypothetical protein